MGIYFAVIAVMLFTDAMICHAHKRRFNLMFAIPCAMAWPVTLPIMVIGCAYLTRNYPKPSIDRTPDPGASHE